MTTHRIFSATEEGGTSLQRRDTYDRGMKIDATNAGRRLCSLGMLYSLGIVLLGSLVVVDSLWAQDRVLFIRQDFGVGRGAVSVTVGDFNGDGHQDLATANFVANSVSILLGQGDGTFQAAPDVGVGRPHFGVTVGDFNGDGHQDLATTNIGPNLPNSVSILLGQGNGTFQAAPDVEVGADPRGVIVGDFNGDGHQDLAVANAFSNSVSILLGQGDGTFQAAPDVEVGATPTTVIIGDFNGDGYQDLATSNVGHSTVSIRLGRGNGTFEVAPNLGVGDQPHSIAVGDFNGDSHQDLATPSLTASSVSILLGQGDGTFQAAPNVGVGLGAISVTVGDFNGDGHHDVVAANQNIDSVSILLGQGDGTFAAAQDFGVGAGPNLITVGDFNGDGRQDLATANVSGTVTILINAGLMVNDLVTFDPIPSTFTFTPNPTGCPEPFVGTFSFEARLINTSDSSLTGLVVVVTTLTNGNLLQNADSGLEGVGARLTVPRQDDFTNGVLSPEERVDVLFRICLTQTRAFQFMVDVAGDVD